MLLGFLERSALMPTALRECWAPPAMSLAHGIISERLLGVRRPWNGGAVPLKRRPGCLSRF